MIECLPFESSRLTSEEWDEFINNSDNGTLFHKRKFLSYHAAGRFSDNSLVIKKKNSIVALIPAALLQDGKKTIFVSHPGASYGGVIYKKDLNFNDAFQIINLIIDYAKKNKITRIQITPPPAIYQSKYSNYIDFALIKNNFKYLRREISSVVQLDVDIDNVLKTYKPEARTAVKKAIKSGVEISECDHFEEYYQILKKNLKLRHNVNPTHSLDELIRIKKLFPGDIRLWGAFLKEKLIAGVCNFSVNSKVVLAFYISHNEEYQENRAVNLLFYEIMKKYKEEGYKFLDFGIFTVDMEPNWGLARFKENFGARGIFRDTYYKDI